MLQDHHDDDDDSGGDVVVDDDVDAYISVSYWLQCFEWK